MRVVLLRKKGNFFHSLCYFLSPLSLSRRDRERGDRKHLPASQAQRGYSHFSYMKNEKERERTPSLQDLILSGAVSFTLTGLTMHRKQIRGGRPLVRSIRSTFLDLSMASSKEESRGGLGKGGSRKRISKGVLFPPALQLWGKEQNLKIAVKKNDSLRAENKWDLNKNKENLLVLKNSVKAKTSASKKNQPLLSTFSIPTLPFGPSKNPASSSFPFLSPSIPSHFSYMKSENKGSHIIKKRFFKERNAYLIPDFVEIQRKSFFKLLEHGLIEEFAKRNPITNKNLEIFFYPEYYQLTPPEYNPRRAILIEKSYSSKLFMPVQLTDKTRKKSQLKWVLIGNLPLMTKRGHFVLNGAPRVIVNQILRSPGIYFQGTLKEIYSEQWSEKPEKTLKRFYTDLICLRGTWLRIEIDKNKDVWAQMKKVPKIPLLWFLLAMGLTERIIFKSVLSPTRLLANFNLEIKRKMDYEYVTNASDAWKAISSLISSSNTEASSSDSDSDLNISELPHSPSSSSSFPVPPVPLGQGGQEGKGVPVPVPLGMGMGKELQGQKQTKGSSFSLRRNIADDTQKVTEKAQGIKKKLVSFLNIVEHSKEGRNWIFKRFMNPRAYDLGTQGRLNFNRKLGLSISSSQTTLTAQDVLFATDYLFKVEKGLKNIDDIDHLKNRRVRTSGELIQIQIGIGLVRLEKVIRDKLAIINAQTRASDFLSSKPNKRKLPFTSSSSFPSFSHSPFPPFPLPKAKVKVKGMEEGTGKGGTGKDPLTKELPTEREEFKINNLINTKAFNGALREFFGSSQLSQFMDQLNPLAEITHKRRLSSMGPGGVTRDSATLAIRGIHPTHYGRICPIETPEGKNTGLVNSLTTYARASSQGFLESPFYKVYKGQVQKNAGMFFLSAQQEENIKLASADVATPSGRIGFLPKNKIPAKIAYGDTISKISRNVVEYIGVSPIQMISIATSLIPFLEHDDANRALMGSNMQRQAVPLVRAERPLVGTGLESRAVSDSGHAMVAKKSGYVAYVSGKKLIVYTIPSQN